ncbi:hypothetical protein LIER_07117 [Lithospermum erythrorhizon]|uniref:Uncharacterized protein n=1 Tax=Lithospermum erythrorhizon TaxID=34254 RepID=A0AAV3P7C0_LITER
MSSSNVHHSSDHYDSLGYARETPANQEVIAESQPATPAEIALQEGVISADDTIQATKAGVTKKKNKALIKVANHSSAGDKAASSKAKDKKGLDPTILRKSLPIGVDPQDLVDILLVAKNTISLSKMRGKRHIAFKNVKRNSEGSASQGKEKRVKAASELSNPPKEGIPPSPFFAYDPLMASGFYTIEFLELPYTLPGGQQICEGTPFKSKLQSFHAMRPLLLEGLCEGFSRLIGFELARQTNHFDEENKDLQAQVPLVRTTKLEVELARVKKELDEDRRVNVLLNAEKRKLVHNSLELRRKLDEVTAQRDKLEVENSGFDLHITQLSEIRDNSVAESSRAS